MFKKLKETFTAHIYLIIDESHPTPKQIEEFAMDLDPMPEKLLDMFLVGMLVHGAKNFAKRGAFETPGTYAIDVSPKNLFYMNYRLTKIK